MVKRNFEEIISIDNKNASVTWGMNSQGFLYLKNLDVSGVDLLETIELSEQGIRECIRIMNEVNKREEPKEETKNKNTSKNISKD